MKNGVVYAQGKHSANGTKTPLTAKFKYSATCKPLYCSKF